MVDQLPMGVWSVQRFVNRPFVAIKPHPKRPLSNVFTFSPFSQALCLALEFNKPVRSAVSDLLCICRPSAIVWAIISIHVDSVYRMFCGWGVAHICKKRFKAAIPSIANFYSSAAILPPALIIFIAASGSHFYPSAINLCASVSMFVAIFLLNLFTCFLGQTTTRSCQPSLQAGSLNNLLIVAFALTKPVSPLAFFSPVKTQNTQPPKTAARQVLKFFRILASTRFLFFQKTSNALPSVAAFTLAIPHSAIPFGMDMRKGLDVQDPISVTRQVFDLIGQYNIFSHCLLSLGWWLGGLSVFQTFNSLYKLYPAEVLR